MPLRRHILLFALAFAATSASAQVERPPKFWFDPYYGSEVFHYAEGECYGPCPVFDIYVFPDGLVLYRGHGTVGRPQRPMRVGDALFKRDAGLYGRLLERLEAADFDSFLDDYGEIDQSMCGSYHTDARHYVVDKISRDQRKIVILDNACTKFTDEKRLRKLISDLQSELDIESMVYADSMIERPE